MTSCESQRLHLWKLARSFGILGLHSLRMLIVIKECGGKLIYLTVARPAIVYALSVLSQFIQES